MKRIFVLAVVILALLLASCVSVPSEIKVSVYYPDGAPATNVVPTAVVPTSVFTAIPATLAPTHTNTPQNATATNVASYSVCLSDNAPAFCYANANTRLSSPYTVVTRPDERDGAFVPSRYDYFFERGQAPTNSLFIPVKCGNGCEFDFAYRNGAVGYTFLPALEANQRAIVKVLGTYQLNTDRSVKPNLTAGDLQLGVYINGSPRVKLSEWGVNGNLTGSFEAFWVIEPTSNLPTSLTVYVRIPFGVNLASSVVTFTDILVIRAPSDFGNDVVKKY